MAQQVNIKAEQRMKKLLEIIVQQGASDLHISVGKPPVLRIDGALSPLAGENIISKKDSEELLLAIMNDRQKNQLSKELSADFSYELEGKARFRVNVYFQLGVLSGAFRLINSNIRTIEELGLPEILRDFTKLSQGLILFVGPTGHGKSTSMAALLDEINHKRAEHIVTIEDPIEYVYNQDLSIINQREIGQDALSFSTGLRAAFRQDIDVILVGEMRDAETIGTAITAAETGHLIFSTLHTNDAGQTIDRIIDVFPGNQQNQIRSQLSSVLSGIVSQRLIPKIGGGRVAAVEVLLKNDAVESMIRENQTHQVINVMETNIESGMQSINRSLAGLVKEGKITLEDAERYATDRDMLHMLIR
ncbi:MAG: PilT/PilU family type 4a pilus ATPase [Candidatus Moranbacteria bacterium]|nr:PilT/PilU family type 4a pilus ATPase [Candidatus Moranbacteria bacterium]